MMIFEDKQQRETERTTNNFERLTRNPALGPGHRDTFNIRGSYHVEGLPHGKLPTGRWTLIANRDRTVIF